MEYAIWAVLVGMLLVLMALSGTVLARLPLSTAMLYMVVGLAVSPLGLGLLDVDPRVQTNLLERLTEAILLVSLFVSGLKLSPGLRDWRWLPPLRLALTSMLVTVAGIAAVAHFLIGLPLGASVLLGAILAPTDPVLASDVQVHRPGDRDELRFALTGEGGLNDGTAYPFAMLGLGLMGLHELGDWGREWVLGDLLWASVAGLAAGALLGLAIGKLVLFLRREHKEAVGLDDFLALGLIALSYGTAVLLQGNGFLAVFAAGVALRQLEQSERPTGTSEAVVAQAAVATNQSLAEAAAVDRRHAPAYMAQAVLAFIEHIERIGELAIVIVIGAVLAAVKWHHAVWWFVPLLLLVIRPVSVAVGLLGGTVSRERRWLIGWFGIRGIGSMYYLVFALNRGIDGQLADQLVALTLSVVVTSIVVHGISVTPLMALYERGRRHRRGLERHR
jgi:NhaP-type Na+/H+ or K+/H+ antiporter